MSFFIFVWPREDTIGGLFRGNISSIVITMFIVSACYLFSGKFDLWVVGAAGATISTGLLLLAVRHWHYWDRYSLTLNINSWTPWVARQKLFNSFWFRWHVLARPGRWLMYYLLVRVAFAYCTFPFNSLNDHEHLDVSNWDNFSLIIFNLGFLCIINATLFFMECGDRDK